MVQSPLKQLGVLLVLPTGARFGLQMQALLGQKNYNQVKVIFATQNNLCSERSGPESVPELGLDQRIRKVDCEIAFTSITREKEKWGGTLKASSKMFLSQIMTCT